MFDNILIGVDGHPGGRDAIDLARLLAGPHAHFGLAHVSDGCWLDSSLAPMMASTKARDGERLLENERELDGIDAVLHAVCDRTVSRGLCDTAEEHGYNLIVIGSSRRRSLLGDDARGVLHHAETPVAIAPRGYTPPDRMQRIGIGHDNSPEAIRGLEVASALARSHDAELSALSVTSTGSIPHGEPLPAGWPGVAADIVEAELQRLQALSGVDGASEYGDPGERLAEFSRDLDLLIVGARGLGPLARLHERSASDHLARHAHCPVLVIPRRSRTILVGDPPVRHPAETIAG
jgi:nucleotide-binding universal stress UspA family protein